ncbi:type II toxin-antitoxin system HicA family toxin [Nostoc sp. CHAB 5836]|uniref:type II toxin-antitoxin system HicA family toxin n=1 Tax=Nostoc sp. CHAB 5836 TaxID=2780404 RepID=UPI00279520E4|nr:type II toxin-antitoxin system HicA family toxin [Nostoc sp. CHAB 5836]
MLLRDISTFKLNMANLILLRNCKSHLILWCESKPTLSIPNHRELAPGLVRSLIRQAGITVDEFLENK